MKYRIIERIASGALILVAAVVLSVTAFTQQPPGKIAFTSNRDGNREIYVMESDGSKQLRLTNNNLVDDNATWSPDGEKIAFLSQRASGEFAIFIMNADGSQRTEVIPIVVPSYPRKMISWSPDGRHLVISQTNGLDIVEVSGIGRRFLTNGFDPAWSPDGTRILFASSTNPRTLNTIQPDGSNPRVLLSSISMPFGGITGYPDWSPDGTRIAFVGGDIANQSMFMVNSDGSGARYFLNECGGLAPFSPHGCGVLDSLAWSPESNSLAYSAYGYIYVVDQYGNDRVAISVSGGDSNPSWRPLLNKVSISGQVVTPGGQGLRNARVILSDLNGERWIATTSSLGFYILSNVPVYDGYILSVASRRYRFAARVITADGNLTGVDFVGLE